MKKQFLTGFLTGSLILTSFATSAQPTQTGKEAVKPHALAALSDFINSEEIKFKGEGVELSGTLFLPKNKAAQKVPAIMMVADFYSQRDGIQVSKGTHSSYLDLATHWVRRGFAVLRYDRRCTGASECAMNATMAVAADDGLGGIKYLQSRKEIDPKKVFVFGHGDGSFVATGIAGNKEVAGVITTVAPGRNAGKLLREWARQHVQDHKIPEAQAAKYVATMEALILQLGSGGFKSEIEYPDLKDPLIAPLLKSPAYAYSWLLDDPLSLYPLVSGSVLVIHGGKDRRVNAKEGSYIHDALQTGDHKDFETQVLPDMDYFLKVNKGTPSFEVDNDTARPLDPALLKAVDEWLTKKIGK